MTAFPIYKYSRKTNAYIHQKYICKNVHNIFIHNSQSPLPIRRMNNDGILIRWTLLHDERVGEGNGNPLQCSCLENPRDGGACGLPSMGSHRVGHEATWQQQQQPFAVYAINISPSCPQILLLLLRYSWCTILRKFLLYNIAIHNFPVFFSHTTRHEELPQPGIKPVPLAVETRVLTTRLPGKSYVVYFKYTQSYLSIVPQ